MSRIALVTGGGGFLGKAVAVALLRDGFRVRSFSRKAYPELSALGIETVCGDLRDATACINACDGADAVFHVAAQPGIWGDFAAYKAVNVDGTLNIIAGCQKAGAPLVYTSSPSVVFDMRDENGIDERAPYPKRWMNPYSHTKALAEMAVLAAAREGKLTACSIRPHLIYGPGDNHLVPRLIARARAGKLAKIGSGVNKVDLTFVDNAARAHLLAFNALSSGKSSGEAYFISDGEPVVLWEWVNALLSGVGVKPVTKKVPAGLAYMLGAGFEALYKMTGNQNEPPMTRFLARALSCSHYYDISKARRDLGYQPPVSGADGLQLTIEHFQSAAI